MTYYRFVSETAEDIKEYTARAYSYAQFAVFYYDNLAKEWEHTSHAIAQGHRESAQQAREDMKFWKRVIDEIV